MRLTLVGPLPPLRGGISHFTAALEEKLSLDHQVQTVSFRRLYPGILYPGRSDKEPGEIDKRVTSDVQLETLNPITWIRAARAIRSHNPQLVVMQWWTTFLAPALFCLARMLRFFNLSVTFIIHNVFPHEPRKVDRFLSKLVLSQGVSYIVLNKSELERLKEILPKEEQVEVCAHPHLVIFDPGRVTQEEARRELELPQDKTILLFFGFVRPYKGLEVLLESLILGRQDSTDWLLLVAGEIWGDKKSYLEVVSKNALEDWVRFDDRYIESDKVGLYLRAADVFVVPHLRGTQSGALQTALNLGLPSVATEHIAEAIPQPHPENLIVVPPADPKALQEGILRALSLPLFSAPSINRRADDLNQLLKTILMFAER